MLDAVDKLGTLKPARHAPCVPILATDPPYILWRASQRGRTLLHQEIPSTDFRAGATKSTKARTVGLRKRDVG
jgi:hypothetical protein